MTTAAADGQIATDLPAFPPEKLSLRMALRHATATDHEIVDAAFGRFDLASPASYAEFLTAHARVLGPLKSAVAGLWSLWQPRFPFLTADLHDLKHEIPAGNAVPSFSDAEKWGVLYVLEGSRLGGGILAGRVGAGLPSRYLSAKHEGGSWKHFADALDHAGDAQGDAWQDAAIAGARSAFARFAVAASETIS